MFLLLFLLVAGGRGSVIMLVLMTVIMQPQVTAQVLQVAQLYLINSAQLSLHNTFILQAGITQWHHPRTVVEEVEVVEVVDEVEVEVV